MSKLSGHGSRIKRKKRNIISCINIGYLLCLADPDLWFKEETRPSDGAKYYTYFPLYLSFDPASVTRYLAHYWVVFGSNPRTAATQSLSSVLLKLGYYFTLPLMAMVTPSIPPPRFPRAPCLQSICPCISPSSSCLLSVRLSFVFRPPHGPRLSPAVRPYY